MAGFEIHFQSDSTGGATSILHKPARLTTASNNIYTVSQKKQAKLFLL